MTYQRIRNLREDNDLTQTDIANILNVSQRAYSRYENAERSVPIEVLIALSKHYGVSIDYLLNQTDVKKPYPRKDSN